MKQYVLYSSLKDQIGIGIAFEKENVFMLLKENDEIELITTWKIGKQLNIIGEL